MATSIPINADSGRVLQILVENQGRINYAVNSDFKGIVGDALLQNKTIYNWTMTGFPFEETRQLDDILTDYFNNEVHVHGRHSVLSSGPVLYQAHFDIDADEIDDTYIDPRGWGKVKWSFF